MIKDEGKEGDFKLNEVPPRETAGRDAIARFQAQFRAAAYECLSLLNGKTIDRVYCDYHDDFVCREQKSGKPVYHFYQVKTKSQRNYQWNKLEILGIHKARNPDAEKMAASFAGKLLLHTIKFNNSCGNVVFLTNVHLDNEMESVAAALGRNDFSNQDLKRFVENFNKAFVAGEPLDQKLIEQKVKKLLLRPGIRYLDPQAADFDAIARKAIYEYSEIDLQHMECEEIIRSLVGLVERKSFSKLISDLDERELDNTAGIGISDLLEILSISKGAYQLLLEGGDTNAVKHASIIQRKLSEAQAGEEMIEFCSKCKVHWDVWFRDKRHTLPEFDLNFLLEELNAIKNLWVAGEVQFVAVKHHIDQLLTKISEKGLTSTLTRDLLLGGILSALVRSESQ